MSLRSFGGSRGHVRSAAQAFFPLALGLSLFLLGSSAAVGAQGLGDVAARERERRDSEPQSPAPAFTNDDLADATTAGETAEEENGASESGSPPAPLSPAGGEESDREFRDRVDRERAERALKEREWRARFAEGRARLREAEARGWRDVVRTELYQGIPVQMRVKEFVETEEYRQAKKDLADLQEEFRRTGLPPGWARE